MDLYRMPAKPDGSVGDIIFKVGKETWIRPDLNGGVTIFPKEEAKALKEDLGYYNQLGVAIVECYLERLSHPEASPVYELRDQDGKTILTSPDLHWSFGYALDNADQVKFVIQHLCGAQSGTTCPCYILFSAAWMKS
jgi:hypothetical protein